MELHPLLEDLARWRDEDHFYSERYFWWQGFSGFNGQDWVSKNLEKDVHTQPTADVDFKSGQPIHEISEFKFSYNLGLKIEREFKVLYQAIQEKEILLEKESQRKRFRFLLMDQLNEILEKVYSLEIPSLYRNIMAEKLKAGIEVLEYAKSTKKIPFSCWYFQYGETDGLSREEIIDRKTRIHYFIEDLENSSMIKESAQNRQNLKNFLNNKNLTDYIIWTGSKSELVYFIRELVRKSYIDSENHWNAVQACFKIFKKEKEFSTGGLKSEKGTQSLRKRKQLESIISNLNF